jgi:hypothetical protein
MEDTETPRMKKYGVSKTTQIMMATVRHVTSSSGLRHFKALDFCWTVGTTIIVYTYSKYARGQTEKERKYEVLQ